MDVLESFHHVCLFRNTQYAEGLYDPRRQYPLACGNLMLYKFLQMKTILSFGTDSSSWWEVNGPGCKSYLPNRTIEEEDPYHSPRPDLIKDCIVDFHYVEAVQAILHVILAVCLI